MTELQWEKLKPGDQIVNKRQPGIPLTVTGWNQKALLVTAPHGNFLLSEGRYLEFALLLKQEKLPL